MADPVAPDMDFDPVALRRRYADERAKRLRSDGKDQYLEVAGRYAAFAKDRFAPLADRPAIDALVDALVVGGGFGGLLAGARLRDAGLADVRIVEKGGQIGGTWYWNQYPGAQCDIESYIYLPLLEELGVVPSERYARAPEILAHAQRIAERYGLSDTAVLGTEVTSMEWSDKAGRWTVRTDRGDRFEARFVVTATGPLHRPKLPGVEGIGEFAGQAFHTSRWDYGYTGGDPEGGLDRLATTRVAVIGTGATAVQIVPHLAEAAEHLFVFQRTPSPVDVRGRDGRTLTEKWDDGGMRTLHGTLTHGYPNLFVLGQSQAAWTANYTQLLDEGARHIAAIVSHMQSGGLATIEATEAAEDAWAQEIVANATNGTGGIGGTDCTPGYYNNEGQPLDGPPWGASYGKGSIEFFRTTKAWRESGTFEGVTFTPQTPAI